MSHNQCAAPLGTYSHSATARVPADLLNVAWENVIIERGDSRLGLPWNSPQDALGGHLFNRTPVSIDMILNALSGRQQAHKPLQVNSV